MRNLKNVLLCFVLAIPMVFLGVVNGGEMCESGDVVIDAARDSPYYNEFDTECVNIVTDLNDSTHIVWVELQDNYYSVYYTKLDVLGNDLVDDKLLFHERAIEPKRPEVPERFREPPVNRDPDIEIDSKQCPHIAFEVNNNLYYTKLNNNGGYIIPPFNLTINQNSATDIDLIVDLQDSVHVVWMDYRTGPMYIFYAKLSNHGDFIMRDRKMSNIHSFDPSGEVDSQGRIHLCWFYLETERGVAHSTRMCYVRMTDDGQFLHRRSMDFLGDEFAQSSVELVVSSQDEPAFVWTKDNTLTYFHLGQAVNISEEQVEQTYDLAESEPAQTFDIKKEATYSTDIDTIYTNCRYILQVTMSKHIIGESEGVILLTEGTERPQRVDRWNYEHRAYVFDTVLEEEVTDLIDATGTYNVTLRQTKGLVFPKIHSVKLIVEPGGDVEADFSQSLSTRTAFEPAPVVDKNDEIHIVWYDSTRKRGELCYLECDYQGNILVDTTRITDDTGEVYDPAVDLDSQGFLTIIYFDTQGGTDAIYYMKLNGANTSEVAPGRRVSNHREPIVEEEEEEEEENSDDQDEDNIDDSSDDGRGNEEVREEEPEAKEEEVELTRPEAVKKKASQIKGNLDDTIEEKTGEGTSPFIYGGAIFIAAFIILLMIAQLKAERKKFREVLKKRQRRKRE